LIIDFFYRIYSKLYQYFFLENNHFFHVIGFLK
jgi:hypothetical protein